MERCNEDSILLNGISKETFGYHADAVFDNLKDYLYSLVVRDPMKKIFMKIFICIFIILFAICVLFYIYKYIKNRSDDREYITFMHNLWSSHEDQSKDNIFEYLDIHDPFPVADKFYDKRSGLWEQTWSDGTHRIVISWDDRYRDNSLKGKRPYYGENCIATLFLPSGKYIRFLLFHVYSRELFDAQILDSNV